LAVKPGKPDRKRTQRDSAAPRKTSRPPGATSRPPVARAPSGTARPPAANSALTGRSSRRPPRPDARPASSRPPHGSQPEITLKRSAAGRDTLSAIAEELARDAPQKHRPKLDTLDYEDRPALLNRPAQDSSPEVITIAEGTMGRATLAAIDEALAAEARATMAAAERSAPVDSRHAASSNHAPAARTGSKPALQPAEIFEISTFIVEGDEIFSKASDKSRREFVEERLLHRLPALSMDEVVRIDFSRGAAPNTVILRVWSRVGQPTG
jgi:hypothetical protein